MKNPLAFKMTNEIFNRSIGNVNEEEKGIAGEEEVRTEEVVS